MQKFRYVFELIVTHEYDPIKPTQLEGNVAYDEKKPPTWSTELEVAQAMLNASILHVVSMLQKIKMEDTENFDDTLRTALRRIRVNAWKNPSDAGFTTKGHYTEDDLKDINI